MTLQQLKYIVAIDEHRHFGKAAETCGLTQSTLSLMVKKLEDELDVTVFDRDAHPLAPTEIGRKIIDKARIVLFNAAQISEMTRTEKEILSGAMNLALISTVAPVLVPGLFKFFGANYPSVSLRTEEMLTDTILDRLRRAEVDMAVMLSPVREEGLLEIPLWTERFFAYVSESDPAYALEQIPADSLPGRLVWIMHDGIRLLDKADFSPSDPIACERFFEGGRVGTLIQIVNENGGLTLIPETHISLILYSFQKNLRPIVGPELKRTISLVIRKDYIHEARLNAVVRAIKSIVPTSLLEGIVRSDSLRL